MHKRNVARGQQVLQYNVRGAVDAKEKKYTPKRNRGKVILSTSPIVVKCSEDVTLKPASHSI